MSTEAIEQRSRREDFVGFRCWDDAAATRVLDREAAAASRQLLLATHVPPRLRRVSASAAGQFDDLASASQQGILNVLLGSTADSLVVPIIGASGSGKSHLVLWLREQLRDDASPDQLRVIYVPKSQTSLSGVIEIILHGCVGASYDQLRKDVRRASASMSERERALRFRAELAVRIETGDFLTDDSQRRQSYDFLKPRLPALINDPVYEGRLLSTGGALQRVVDDATRGGAEQAAKFNEEDFPLDLTVQEQEDLGATARELLRLLNNADLRRAAINMLNDVRDRALMAVFGVAPSQLLKVFEDLRREIRHEAPHQRLVLMIEDFTLLQGIQYDLLEAMIANARPGEDKKLELAPMTTVMAVTKGFLQSVFTSTFGGDTVRTRIADHNQLYSLDSPYGEDHGYEPMVVRDFVGGYLNAVRTGAPAIEASFPEVPNACDSCEFRDRCHDAFGVSNNGFGLYPFNGQAIDRMVRGMGDDFNPRKMLSALQQTLTTHGEDLRAGAFPSESWARLFDRRVNGVHGDGPPTLSLRVEREAESTPSGAQRVRLLTFWGGVPERLVDLDTTIHEAFAIPPVGAKVYTPPAPDISGHQSAAVTVDQVAITVQAWRDGARLDADLSREVRRMLGSAVLQALRGEPRLLARSVENLFSPERDIDIKGAQGGGGPSKNRFVVEVRRDREGIDLVEGILRAIDPRVPAGQRLAAANWDFQGGAARLALLLEFAAREAERLAGHVRTQAVRERADREAAVCALYVSGLVLGHGSHDSAEGKAAAMFLNKEIPTKHLPSRLGTVYKRLAEQRADIRDFVFEQSAVRRGTGATIGIEPSAALDVIRAFEANWDLPTAPEDARSRPLAATLAGLDVAFNEARTWLSEWQDAVAHALGHGTLWQEVCKVARDALDTATREGYASLPRGGADVPKDDQIGSAIRQVDTLLAGWESLPTHQRGRALSGLPWARLEPAKAEVLRLRYALDRATDTATQAVRGAEGATAFAELEQALAKFDHGLATLPAEEESDV